MIGKPTPRGPLDSPYCTLMATPARLCVTCMCMMYTRHTKLLPSFSTQKASLNSLPRVHVWPGRIEAAWRDALTLPRPNLWLTCSMKQKAGGGGVKPKDNTTQLGTGVRKAWGRAREARAKMPALPWSPANSS